jgi:transcriptional regulator with XRE-family HTH domain
VVSLDDVIASNLRGERARRRWTQADLAERLGWPERRVLTTEIGRRTLRPSELAVICRILDVTLLELARGADEDDLRALGLISPTRSAPSRGQ